MSRKLKLAIDATPLLGNRTGVGTVAANIFEHIGARDDFDVTGFIVSYSGGADLLSRLPGGIKSHHVRFPARISHRLWERFDWPSLSGYDLVHGVNYVVPPASGAVELVTIHDLTAWRFPALMSERNRSFPSLVERAIDRGAHIHVVSNFIAQEVGEYLGVEDERITVVPNGASPLTLGDAANAKSLVQGEYLLAIGTIEPRKDYPSLIRAMDFVWEAHPDMKLVVVGADGWAVEEFNTALAKSSRPNNIVRLGFVDDQTRADLLAGCQMLVYPSVYEGFGLPILEAMSVGVPVVATQIGAVTEVAGSAALLVPPKSATALAGSIMDLLDDETARKHFAEAGKRRVKAFSWESTAQQTFKLYEKLGRG